MGKLALFGAYSALAVLIVKLFVTPENARPGAAMAGFAVMVPIVLIVCRKRRDMIVSCGVLLAMQYVCVIDPGYAGDLTMPERATSFGVSLLGGVAMGNGLFVVREDVLRLLAWMCGGISEIFGLLRGDAVVWEAAKNRIDAIDSVLFLVVSLGLGLWPEAFARGGMAVAALCAAAPLLAFIHHGFQRPLAFLLGWANSLVLTALAYYAGLHVPGSRWGGVWLSLFFGFLIYGSLLRPLSSHPPRS